MQQNHYEEEHPVTTTATTSGDPFAGLPDPDDHVNTAPIGSPEYAAAAAQLDTAERTQLADDSNPARGALSQRPADLAMRRARQVLAEFARPPKPSEGETAYAVRTGVLRTVLETLVDEIDHAGPAEYFPGSEQIEDARRLTHRYDQLVWNTPNLPHPIHNCRCEWCSVTRDAIAIVKQVML